MGRVFRALIVHELRERTRDRWVVVLTLMFVLLASGIVLYGNGAGDRAAVVTAPSLVTLCGFLVPLVALVLGHDAVVGERERHTLGLLLSLPIRRSEVLVAKFIGRALALVLALSVGFGSAALLMGASQRAVVLSIVPATVLLGLAFLALGMLISSVTRRVATAASLAVAAWFVLVFFWDLVLLALMVATDGALGQDVVAGAVVANPAGLYRVGLMAELVGQANLAELGLAIALPTGVQQAGLWAAWIALPLGIGGALLQRDKAVVA